MRAVVFALLLSACPKPPPPVWGKLMLPAPPCPLVDGSFPIPSGLCAGKFAGSGFACAICVYHSCTDVVDMMYCADTCLDPLCQ